MDLKTVLLSIVVFMLFVGRRYITDYYKRKKNSFDNIRDRAMIDRAVDVLDGKFTRPFPDFVPPSDAMEILEREPSSEYGMNIFLQSVAEHCGFDRNGVVLRAFPPKEGMPPGRITKMGSLFLMELYMDNGANLDGVLAVIVHEFCHFFLDRSGLELKNTIENEVLTDTAAIYFGFGDVMRKGYAPRLVESKKGENSWRTIGYLDTLSIDYVRNRLQRRKVFYSQASTVPR